MYLALPATQNIALARHGRHKPDTSRRSNTAMPITGTPIMYNLLETPLALLAGLLTIASPCILPVLPILLGTSVDRPDRVRPLFIIAGFILTFACFAMLLGAVSSAVQVAQEALRNTAIALLALSGLLRLWSRPYEWLVERLRQPLQRMFATAAPAAHIASGNTGGFVLGMSLGAVWTPCAGPVLASILVLVVKAQDLGWSALLLTLYAIGAAIPMLAIIYGGQYMTHRVRLVARHAQRLQQMFGVLVMLTALAIYLQYDILAYSWAAAFIPSLKGL
jgi:cytochrome c biogenesis protein CcdA